MVNFLIRLLYQTTLRTRSGFQMSSWTWQDVLLQSTIYKIKRTGLMSWYPFACFILFCFIILKMRRKLQYLLWGEAEAAWGISKDCQVIPQRPAWTTATFGHSLSLHPHMLLAQVLELGLGANLFQRRQRFFLNACPDLKLFHKKKN